MTIGDIQSINNSSTRSQADGPAARNTEQAARNRELAEAVRAINEGGGIGPSSELRFSIDHDSGRALIKIVDRVTDEVITQLPPEEALRTAEILKSLRPGDRIA